MLVSTCARVLSFDRHKTAYTMQRVFGEEVGGFHNTFRNTSPNTHINQAIHGTHDTYVHDGHQQVWRNTSRGILRKGEPLYSLLKHLPGIHEKCIVPAVTM